MCHRKFFKRVDTALVSNNVRYWNCRSSERAWPATPPPAALSAPHAGAQEGRKPVKRAYISCGRSRSLFSCIPREEIYYLSFCCTLWNLSAFSCGSFFWEGGCGVLYLTVYHAPSDDVIQWFNKLLVLKCLRPQGGGKSCSSVILFFLSLHTCLESPQNTIFIFWKTSVVEAAYLSNTCYL
jgi:hypothetical protein